MLPRKLTVNNTKTKNENNSLKNLFFVEPVLVAKSTIILDVNIKILT